MDSLRGSSVINESICRRNDVKTIMKKNKIEKLEKLSGVYLDATI